MKRVSVALLVTIMMSLLSACTDVDKEKPTSTPLITNQYEEPATQTTSPSLTPSPTVEPSPIAEPSEIVDGLLKHTSEYNWSIMYPSSWNRSNERLILEENSGKFIEFRTFDIPDEGVDWWLKVEMKRLLSSTETNNKLFEGPSSEERDGYTIHKYVIESSVEKNSTLLRHTIIIDDHNIFAFHTASPPLTKEEYEEIMSTFKFEK
ncbi:hypothetical protein [Paenibacillus paeoniae]|uniref:DUF1795 domain-containing protein n=1 Tax=Paenibacillus paeoniae TaxID=2292705 RepID=A0A371P6D6_9BACL|nr:hypothetical protein [Paenibacillus paeoniae]REK71514.1 hypothetical protein DX130_21170 [Paenibacillus paeoniae]